MLHKSNDPIMKDYFDTVMTRWVKWSRKVFKFHLRHKVASKSHIDTQSDVQNSNEHKAHKFLAQIETINNAILQSDFSNP